MPRKAPKSKKDHRIQLYLQRADLELVKEAVRILNEGDQHLDLSLSRFCGRETIREAKRVIEEHLKTKPQIATRVAR